MVFFFTTCSIYVLDNVWWHIYAILMQCSVLIDLVVNRDGKDKKNNYIIKFQA